MKRQNFRPAKDKVIQVFIEEEINKSSEGMPN